MPILILAGMGISALGGAWLGAKANASVNGAYVSVQQTTSGLMTYAAVGGAVFILGKTQKWW